MDIQVIPILQTNPFLPSNIYNLITLEVYTPYYVWTELLTHKRFARNASSNRAMKPKKNVTLGYYTPPVFYQQGLGMCSGDSLPEDMQGKAVEIWNNVWQYSTNAMMELTNMGVAKEQASRVLPSFKIMHGVITGTYDAFKSFLMLRNNEQADTAMQILASKILDTIAKMPVVTSRDHYPYVEVSELDNVDLPYLSAGRLARISYGDITSKKDDINLGRRLYHNGHMSPFEHSATWVKNPIKSALCSKENDMMNIYGWENVRASLE